jgi:hypothetical protein
MTKKNLEQLKIDNTQLNKENLTGKVGEKPMQLLLTLQYWRKQQTR